MGRRKKKSKGSTASPGNRPPNKPKPFNNPFAEAGRELGKQLKQQKKAAAAERATTAERATATPPSNAGSPRARVEPLSDDEIFELAMGDADRISADPRGNIQPPPPPRASEIPTYDEEAEVMAQLSDLVDGTTRFDISDSDEFIEGCIEGLDRRILKRLKRGDYAVAAHLDLHGLTREPARAAVGEFIETCHARGQRCILIVHGRGHNSEDNVPVLKGLLKNWLERGRIARRILAFCSAQPHDGGGGAMYVLLRK